MSSIRHLVRAALWAGPALIVAALPWAEARGDDGGVVVDLSILDGGPGPAPSFGAPVPRGGWSGGSDGPMMPGAEAPVSRLHVPPPSGSGRSGSRAAVSSDEPVHLRPPRSPAEKKAAARAALTERPVKQVEPAPAPVNEPEAAEPDEVKVPAVPPASAKASRLAAVPPPPKIAEPPVASEKPAVPPPPALKPSPKPLDVVKAPPPVPQPAAKADQKEKPAPAKTGKGPVLPPPMVAQKPVDVVEDGPLPVPEKESQAGEAVAPKAPVADEKPAKLAGAPPPPPAPPPATMTISRAGVPPPAKTAAVAMPTPREQASLPQEGAGGGKSVRVVFSTEEAKLEEPDKKRLRDLALGLKGDENLRLQLLAFAGGDGMAANRARRLSLSRGLAIRAFLIENGIRSTRIDVRALGDKAEGEPVNRVDVTVVQR